MSRATRRRHRRLVAVRNLRYRAKFGAVSDGVMTVSWGGGGIFHVELHDEPPPPAPPPNDDYARGPFNDDLFSVADGTFSFAWIGGDTPTRPARPWKLPHGKPRPRRRR